MLKNDNAKIKLTDIVFSGREEIDCGPREVHSVGAAQSAKFPADPARLSSEGARAGAAHSSHGGADEFFERNDPAAHFLEPVERERIDISGSGIADLRLIRALQQETS